VQPVWAGHPWVYAQAIDRVEGGATRGDEVRVVDPRGNFLGRGFYSPGSAIPVRLLVRDEDTPIDSALFRTKFERALAARIQLGLGTSPDTTGYRVVHAEGDGVPGLVVDRFGDVLVVQILTLEGFAVFVPNARGSTGYGLDYSKRVDRDWGGLDRLDHVHAMTEVLPRHERVDTARAGLSAIVLSLVDEKGKPQDGFLRTHDIYNLKLPAELVVLSACETGLGKDVKGEGLEGLTRGFMYAGARRVVVSLWNVNDKATAGLMQHLYVGMLKDKKTPAAALRAAQIEMIRMKQWQSPYYWAPFVMQGEWR